MNFTIIKQIKNGDRSLTNIEFNEYIKTIAAEGRDMIITKFRQTIPFLEKSSRWVNYGKIPHVSVAEYKKTRNGERVLKHYNGISVITVNRLNNTLEVDAVKRQAALFPQTLSAMTGADGQSVVILTLATLPDGKLPKDEKLMKLFCAQAYATSVRCLQPSIEFNITIEEPSIDQTILLTYDTNPYVNPHPTPFIIEQPTELPVMSATEMEKMATSSLERGKPGANTYITFTTLFNAASKRAQEALPSWKHGSDPHILITRIAQECVACGLPEEEVAMRLSWRFYKDKEHDVRSTVNVAYNEYKGMGSKIPMSKHQYVAFRLREFLERRYDIRYNEVLGMTEYRTRMSIEFMYKELDRRELNTIHHEACIEGIEPTFGEVDQLVHSAYIPIYNPIREYLNTLPEWDGKDRLTQLAAMVPNNNPHWEQLFTRWMLSMVAHWMNSDTTHANQTAPILIGAQGYRKSTFCRLLLPPELQMFFTDSIDFRSNVDAERCLSRFLLVNIDEFDQLNEKQFAFVKHLFQKPVTNIRRMYSETIGTQRRYASFIGTSNHSEILRDPTGNRRYICVEVTAPIHTDEPINYAQLYAQIKHLITSGERYYLNEEDEALIRSTNTNFEVETPLEQLFHATFSIPQGGEEGEWMTSTEILTHLKSLPTFNNRKDCNPLKLGHVLTKLNIKKKKLSNGTNYYVKVGI